MESLQDQITESRLADKKRPSDRNEKAQTAANGSQGAVQVR